MKSIPDDLLDAARIDGSGVLGRYWHVVVPNIKPAIGTITIFAFLGAWNNFLWPLIILNSRRKMLIEQVLSVLTAEFAQEPAARMAAATMAVVPILLTAMPTWPLGLSTWSSSVAASTSAVPASEIVRVDGSSPSSQEPVCSQRRLNLKRCRRRRRGGQREPDRFALGHRLVRRRDRYHWLPTGWRPSIGSVDHTPGYRPRARRQHNDKQNRQQPVCQGCTAVRVVRHLRPPMGESAPVARAKEN